MFTSALARLLLYIKWVVVERSSPHARLMMCADMRTMWARFSSVGAIGLIVWDVRPHGSSICNALRLLAKFHVFSINYAQLD